jgi:RNA polymerase sigma-70 factor (ECF subfamily)
MTFSAAIPATPDLLASAPRARRSRAPIRDTARDAAWAAERALIERARGRDEGAFRELVELHRDHAFGLALRITRSRVDAEDVAQEAFVRAWNALPGFRGEATFGTWLHSIVARRAIDRAELLRRRRGREAAMDAAPEAEAPPPGAARDPLLARRLESMMSTLSAPQRAVVSLFYGEDRSVEDIAAALSMNENTVKTHLARARTELRAAWLAQGEGSES